MPDDGEGWTWWQRVFCGLCSPRLDKNVRDMAVLELIFQGVAVASLVWTALEDSNGLHRPRDWWSVVDVVLAVPTLVLLLVYVLRWHPHPALLRRFKWWCLFLCGLYFLGVILDAWAVMSGGSTKRLESRSVLLLVDIASLAMFANIVYLITLLESQTEHTPLRPEKE